LTLRTLHPVFLVRISRLIVQNAHLAPLGVINPDTHAPLRHRRTPRASLQPAPRPPPTRPDENSDAHGRSGMKGDERPNHKTQKSLKQKENEFG